MADGGENNVELFGWVKKRVSPFYSGEFERIRHQRQCLELHIRVRASRHDFRFLVRYFVALYSTVCFCRVSQPQSHVLRQQRLRFLVLTSLKLVYFDDSTVLSYLAGTKGAVPTIQRFDSDSGPAAAASDTAGLAISAEGFTAAGGTEVAASFGLDIPSLSRVEALLRDVKPRGEFSMDSFEGVTWKGSEVVLQFKGEPAVTIQPASRSEAADWQMTVRQGHAALMADRRVAASLGKLAAEVQRKCVCQRAAVPVDEEKIAFV